MIVRDLRDVLINLVFPPVCSFCTRSLTPYASNFLCQLCSSDLTKDVAERHCSSCGIFLPKALDAAKCPECKKRNFRFDQVIPLGRYEDTLRTAVIRMKNSSELPLVRSMAHLMADHAYQQLGEDTPDLIIPIPKFWLKRMRNGVNSAEALGNEVARKWGIPAFPRAIKWTRYIRKQSLLSVTERQKNVRNALGAADGYRLTGAHVLLVDDTMTTGATANEATRVLQKAGVSRITVCVVARAIDT